MACAVGIVLALAPQGDPRQDVEIHAARAFGKPRSGDCDMPFENQREIPDCLLRWLTDRNGSGDVGCAVFVLGTRIHQIKGIRL